MGPRIGILLMEGESWREVHSDDLLSNCQRGPCRYTEVVGPGFLRGSLGGRRPGRGQRAFMSGGLHWRRWGPGAAETAWDVGGMSDTSPIKLG